MYACSYLSIIWRFHCVCKYIAFIFLVSVIASICQQSCDLHFSSIDDQLMQLNDFTEDVKQQRKTDHLSSSSTNTPAISQNVTPTHSMENISMDISES